MQPTGHISGGQFSITAGLIRRERLTLGKRLFHPAPASVGGGSSGAAIKATAPQPFFCHPESRVTLACAPCPARSLRYDHLGRGMDFLNVQRR